MKKYIVLLRGINVSGKNKLPMAELRELLNDLGFKNVQTYIQSGNIILESYEGKSVICNKINEGIQNKFGFDVPVIARTIPQFKKAIASYPFPIDNTKIVGFVFLNKKVYVSKIDVKDIDNDKYLIDNDMVFIYCETGFAKTKLSNNLFERKLLVSATTRNYNTTLKLLELAESN
ncbi:DUF1697 domain-containing protein [Polaribacter atrinae]|uniref:DUF1697 domain-containing protein n=1 Tax=Polaribacter atrinae TaxID=1333662 RepID=A0A176TAI1_9FLAO|nr:DUF1697 domain-containing protein [Polaribacter atrinae]OAD44435.1 hypothetical protein LPB303_12365 [Polaribacter atrinae]